MATTIDTSPEGNIQRRTLRMLETCVHFNGIQHERCAAGVRYMDVTGRPGQRPCLRHFSEGAPVCEKRATLSEAEAREKAEAEERDLKEFLGYMAQARVAIIAETGKGGGRGVVACPKCGGRLAYSRAASNGHVHAHCETQGCLAWME